MNSCFLVLFYSDKRTDGQTKQHTKGPDCFTMLIRRHTSICLWQNILLVGQMGDVVSTRPLVDILPNNSSRTIDVWCIYTVSTRTTNCYVHSIHWRIYCWIMSNVHFESWTLSIFIFVPHTLNIAWSAERYTLPSLLVADGTLLYERVAFLRDWDWLFNVTCNDISVIYVTAHRCAGGLKKLNLRSGSQRHRHFVGFFNVPVQAPTRGHPFYTVIRWEYGRHILDLGRILVKRVLLELLFVFLLLSRVNNVAFILSKNSKVLQSGELRILDW